MVDRPGFLMAPEAKYPTDLYDPVNVGNVGGGNLFATLDIPPFSGCHNGPENLDNLMTELASSNDNPVAFIKVSPIAQCLTEPTNPACHPSKK